jgi:hypothetical protein
MTVEKAKTPLSVVGPIEEEEEHSRVTTWKKNLCSSDNGKKCRFSLMGH